jgi:hypothetical protein
MGATDDAHKHIKASCQHCHKRKIKCDKGTPCFACRKWNTECVYSARKPRRRNTPVAAFERNAAQSPDLGQGEVFTTRDSKTNGHDVSLNTRRLQGSKAELQETGSSSHEPGKLIVGRMRTRYLGNNLLRSVFDELPDSNDMLREPDEEPNGDDEVSYMEQYLPDDNMLMFAPKDVDLLQMHPSPSQIFCLWQTFLTNVNPLSKIRHVPTTQELIVGAVADLSEISKSTEALLFGIYATAVLSMSDTECQKMLDQSKSAATSRFNTGLQVALSRAGFMTTSNVEVLQAYVLFLVSLDFQNHADYSFLFAQDSTLVLFGFTQALPYEQRSGLACTVMVHRSDFLSLIPKCAHACGG